MFFPLIFSFPIWLFYHLLKVLVRNSVECRVAVWEWKTVRARGVGWLQANGSCTYELKAFVDVYTRLWKLKGKKKTARRLGGGHKVLPFAEELLAIDSCQERREIAFFIGEVPSRSATGWPYSQEYTVSINQTGLVFKKWGHNVGWLWIGVALGEVEGGNKDDHKIMYEIPRELIKYVLKINNTFRKVCE